MPTSDRKVQANSEAELTLVWKMMDIDDIEISRNQVIEIIRMGLSTSDVQSLHLCMSVAIILEVFC